MQYQGSKRKLAQHIFQYLPQQFNRLIEPFHSLGKLVTPAMAMGYVSRPLSPLERLTFLGRHFLTS